MIEAVVIESACRFVRTAVEYVPRVTYAELDRVHVISEMAESDPGFLKLLTWIYTVFIYAVTESVAVTMFVEIWHADTVIPAVDY